MNKKLLSLLAGLVVYSLNAPTNAIELSFQDGPLPELDVNPQDGLLDSMLFNFSNLPAPSPGEDRLSFRFDFVGLDLGAPTEILRAFTFYDLITTGPFSTTKTITSTSGDDNVNGFITLDVLFSDLLTGFMGGDFGVELVAGSVDVNVYDVNNAPCNTNCGGEVSATLSYDASVPEPTTLALLSLGFIGLSFTRRRMKV